jgi:hypothetical protein
MRSAQRFSFLNMLTLVGVLSLLALSASGQAPAAIKVSLCAVATDPQQYNDKVISVQGQYETDGIEHEALFDHDCNNTGFGLIVSGRAQGVEELRTALQGGRRGTRDKIINGTFTGVFQWKPKDHPSLILNVDRLQDITVAPKPPKPLNKPPVGEQVSPEGSSLYESGHADPPKQR